MEREHVREVCALDPSAAERTVTLNPAGDVADPMDGGIDAIRATADEIDSLIGARWP